MPCSQTLASIPLDCSTSQGGIVKVWLTNYQDGIFTVSANTDNLPVEVTNIESGLTWYEYNFRKGTSSMNSTLNVDEAAGINYVSTELAMVFTKMETAKRTAVAAIALGGVAGICKDANGKYWALGVAEPMYSTSGAATTGTAKTDSNNYSVTLTDDYMSYPLEIPATVAEGVVG